MAIRKRISGNGPEDAAVREAIRLAIEHQTRRIGYLEQDLKDGEMFNADDAQSELDKIRSHMSVWKRLESTPGKIKVTYED